jgi:hypothetical protein
MNATHNVTFQFVASLFVLAAVIFCVIFFKERIKMVPEHSDVTAISSDRIQVNLVAFGDNRRLASTDSVSSSHITIFGKVDSYQKVVDTYSRFDILVNGSSVTIKSSSGEFAQPVFLKTGSNTIDISVKWGDRVHERFAYDITYQPATNTAL